MNQDPVPEGHVAVFFTRSGEWYRQDIPLRGSPTNAFVLKQVGLPLVKFRIQDGRGLPLRSANPARAGTSITYLRTS